METILAVENLDEATEQQEPVAPSVDIPPLDELKRMIEQKQNENLKQFGIELQELLNKYNVNLVPRVVVQGSHVIESAIIAEPK